MPEKRSKTPTARELEKALETMRALGYKIEPPTLEVESEKQEASIAKLGFKSKKPKVVKENPRVLKCFLVTAHNVGGNTYGPGEVTLDATQEGLFKGLVHQDNLAKAHHYDRADIQPYSKHFLVQVGSGADKNHKYRKVEVNESQFSTGMGRGANPTISVSKFDIAGYNPGSTNRPDMEF